MRSFAELVEEHRRQRRLTQAALANRIGVTQPTLAEWLSGRRPVPTMRLLRLVDALGLRGTTRDELLVAAWLSTAAPPAAHLLRGLLGLAGRRQLAVLVREALAIGESPPTPPSEAAGDPARLPVGSPSGMTPPCRIGRVRS